MGEVRKIFGVLGEHLGHSLSPAMFSAILPQVSPGSAYVPFEISPARLAEFIASTRLLPFCGFNVTLPHKVEIIPHLDDTRGAAFDLGAVNCVVCRDGLLVGHNTDAEAFLASLGEAPAFSQTLVLGAGGAARAAVHALRTCVSGPIHMAARRPLPDGEVRFADCLHHPFDERSLQEVAAACDLIVNATPVGMYPLPGFSPLSGGFHSGQVVFDMVYNPRPTRFLQLAQAAGARTIDGLEMLGRQAAESLRLWTGARVAYQKFMAAARRELTSR